MPSSTTKTTSTQDQERVGTSSTDVPTPTNLTKELGTDELGTFVQSSNLAAVPSSNAVPEAQPQTQNQNQTEQGVGTSLPIVPTPELGADELGTFVQSSNLAAAPSSNAVPEAPTKQKRGRPPKYPPPTPTEIVTEQVVPKEVRSCAKRS